MMIGKNDIRMLIAADESDSIAKNTGGRAELQLSPP